MRKLFFMMMAVLACSFSALAQTNTFHGKVVDAANDEPLIGATVSAVGSTQAVVTDLDGNFSITVPASVKQIKVSYVGFTPMLVALKNNMTIMLQSATENLDELVVVAYGQQKKSSITGAISQVNSEQIEQRPVSSVAQALEGATSGITVTANYGQPGNDPTVIIRGVGTVNGTTTPLYVIDGVPFGGNISDLNPDDIASMSVLKDAASTALYGNRASNGVILITTKKAKNDKLSLNFKTSQGWYVRGIPEYERTNAEQFMKVEYQNQMNEILANRYDGVYSVANMAEAHSAINESVLAERLYTNIWNAPDNMMYSDIYGNLTSNVIKGTYAEDLDWWSQSTRAGYRSDYNLSGSGTSDKSDYYFSLGYLKEDGFMNKSGFNRLSARGVINIKPVKWIKAGLNVNVSHQELQNSKGNGDDNSSYVNPVYYSRYMSPIYPVHLHDAATGQYTLDADGNKQFDAGYYANGAPTRKQNADRHCIWENELNSARGVRNTINGIGTIDIYLPFGITVAFKGNMNVRNSNSDEYSSAVIGDGQADHGRFKRTSYRYKNYNFQQQIFWDYSFNDKHYLNVLLGHENYRYNYDYEYIFKKGESFAGVCSLSNFATVNSATGYQNNYATESYLARVQYNFDDRYNIEASYRRDGTSRFSKQSRWGNFGSVGANWIFSKEAFLRDASWIDFGKIRADWGHVANDGAAGYYAYLSLYDTSSSGTNAGQPAYWYAQSGNADLHWETGESWGLALETRLFNRWNFSIEYYKRVNKDLLFDLYDPLSAGAQDPYYAESTKAVNLGKISNSGIEINTDVDIVKTKDWTFNFGMNLTTLRNRVLELPKQNRDGIISGSHNIKEGHDRYAWYTYHYEGVDQMNGKAVYTPDFEQYHIILPDNSIYGGSYQTDENGNPTSELASTAIPDGQYVKVGDKYYVYNTTYGERDFHSSSLPSVYGAFTPSVRYKNVSLSGVVTWSLGGKIMDYTYQSLMSVSSSANNYHVDALNAWYGVPEGMTETSADRISTDVNPANMQSISSYNNATTDRFLISRNYIVLKNINLSYSLPKGFLNQIGVQKALLTFAAENVFTKTARKGLDAQQTLSGYQYNYIPSSRVFTFALSVTL